MLQSTQIFLFCASFLLARITVFEPQSRGKQRAVVILTPMSLGRGTRVKGEISENDLTGRCRETRPPSSCGRPCGSTSKRCLRLEGGDVACRYALSNARK